MKKTLLLLIVALATMVTSVWGSEFAPYIPRDDDRSAVEAARQLILSPSLPLFTEETGLSASDLRRAIDEGRISEATCGECKLLTAGIKDGRSEYHRQVRQEEPVAYIDGRPVFLPACGNPVRPIAQLPPPEPECVDGPPTYHPGVSTGFSTPGAWAGGWWGWPTAGYGGTTFPYVEHSRHVRCPWVW